MQVFFVGVDVSESCQGELARLWVVIGGESAICAYATARSSGGVVPGIWAVNDPACHR